MDQRALLFCLFLMSCLKLVENQSIIQAKDENVHVFNASLARTSLQLDDSWNDRLKSAIEKIADEIPYVGGLISYLVELFWPLSKEDIWDLIKDQVKNLIDAEILKKELEQRQAELHGLNKTLHMYVDAKMKEKGSIMSSLLAIANELYSKLTESSNSHHLIPLTCASAHLHLGLLLERLTHGKEIYEEDNTPTWTRELIEQHDQYKKFFITVFPKWKDWRSSLITAGWGRFTRGMPLPPFFYWVAYGDASDSKTGEKVHYEQDFDAIETTFKDIMQAIQLRMMRQAEAEMISETMSTSFTINAYLPGQAKAAPDVDPAIETFVMGPYSSPTLGHGTYPFKADMTDKPGKITQIIVREWNSIDMLQFTYTDHQGKEMGNPKGGHPHTIVPKNGAHFTGFKMFFADNILCSIEVCMSDGSTSGVLGNRGGWQGYHVESVVDSSYELIGANFRYGYSPSSGVGVIELVFRHFSRVHVSPNPKKNLFYLGRSRREPCTKGCL